MRLHEIEKCKSMFAGFKFQGQTVFELTYKLSVIVYRNVNYCCGVNTSVIFFTLFLLSLTISQLLRQFLRSVLLLPSCFCVHFLKCFSRKFL